MNWPTLHRVRPVSKQRHSVLLHLFAIVIALTPFIPTAQPAYAASDFCITIGSTTICPDFPPPDLLYHLGGIYAATWDQAASLKYLEIQATQNIIAAHSLTPDDADAVKSWARADAQAELFALLVQAIKTPAASRTIYQQNAVDWITAVAQRQNVAAAEAAGREYVKWAGLSQSGYESLLATNPSQSDLTSFLSGTPDTVAWCSYRSPTPYGSEYTGYTATVCFNPAPCLFCFPPTPSYDQFVKWGQAQAIYPLLNSPSYLSAAQNIALGLEIGLPLAAAAIAGVEVAPAVAYALATANHIQTSAVAEFLSAITLFNVVAGVTTFLVVLTALTTAIIAGINVTNAAKLPGQLASLISQARTTPPDPATLVSSSSGGTSLFSLYVGATVPTPQNRTCDNSATPPEFTNLGSSSPILFLSSVPCLNPTRIPDPSATVKDPASGSTTTIRLHETWFVTQANGSTAQTLRLAYTDWDGKQQNAWLLGNPTDGYAFVTFSPPADTSTSVDRSTCVASGICGYGASINYVGADGQKYSASARGYQAPTGTPTYSSAVEASPVSFDANKFAPGGAVGGITYQWRFQKAGCGRPCEQFIIINPLPLEVAKVPAYTDPVSGATASYTWQTGGTYSVELKATDAAGVEATTTFQVAVASVPPTLSLSPDCSESSAPCNQWTGETGTPMSLGGTVGHAGTLDNVIVTVNWGDGSIKDVANAGPNSLSLVGNPLTLTAASNNLSFMLAGTHTYTQPGIYYGTVWVADWNGTTESRTFVVTIKGRQTISFPSIGGHSYGQVFPISATGGASGQPVTFSTTPGCALSNVSGGAGTGSATVTVLSAGTCTITANQAGTTTYNPAPSVTQQVVNLLAVLTVTANNKTMTYGGPVPSFDAQVSGLVKSDTSSVVGGLTCVAKDGSQVVGSSTPAGSYLITCNGGSAANYSLSYVAGTLTINKAGTSTALSSSPNPAVYGQPMTFTAAISVNSPGAGHPGGTVAFTDGGSAIAGCAARPVDTATGTATCSTAALGVAQHGVTATYSGDSNFAGSTAATLTQTVNKAAVTTTLVAVANPSIAGQAVTFSATVAAAAPGAGVPTGNVTFKDGTTTLGTGTLSTSNGTTVASFTASGLGVGQHTITATYSGDGNFLAGAGAALTQYVNTNLSGYPKLPSGAYNLSNTNLVCGSFVNAPLAGASLSGANLTSAVFIGANLAGANLSTSNLKGANFVGANLTGANLTSANLTEANLAGANLTGANLKGATGLTTATLTNIIWNKTTCPDGTISRDNGGTCIGHL